MAGKKGRSGPPPGNLSAAKSVRPALARLRWGKPLPSVVKPRGAGIRVPHQLLHVFERHSLLQKIGDGGYAKEGSSCLRG